MTRKKQEWRMAAEAVEILDADPVRAAERARRAEERARYQEELDQAERPIIRDLARAGVAVQSAWDLVNSKARHPTSILPVLFKHLQRPYPAAIRDGLARALATPAAGFAWAELCRLYEDEPNEGVKQGLADALSKMVNDDRAAELFRLASDHRHGGSRLLLLEGFMRVEKAVAREKLTKLAKEKLLAVEAQRLLRKLSRETKGARKKKPPIGSVETSTNVDLPMLQGLLERIAGVAHMNVGGINSLMAAVHDLDVDELGSFEFEAGRGKRKSVVQVNVLMRDPEALDVYFFAPPPLIDEITRVMQEYFEEAGI